MRMDDSLNLDHHINIQNNDNSLLTTVNYLDSFDAIKNSVDQRDGPVIDLTTIGNHIDDTIPTILME